MSEIEMLGEVVFEDDVTIKNEDAKFGTFKKGGEGIHETRIAFIRDRIKDEAELVDICEESLPGWLSVFNVAPAEQSTAWRSWWDLLMRHLHDSGAYIVWPDKKKPAEVDATITTTALDTK